MLEAIVTLLVVTSFALGYIRGRNTEDDRYAGLQRDYYLLKRSTEEIELQHILQVDSLLTEIKRLKETNRGH